MNISSVLHSAKKTLDDVALAATAPGTAADQADADDRQQAADDTQLRKWADAEAERHRARQAYAAEHEMHKDVPFPRPQGQKLEK